MMSYIGICIVTAITICISNWIYRWRNPKCDGRLPPGSMGIPLIGETIQFFRPNRTFDASPFIKEREKRYGPIFKTNLAGQPVVVITDPELVYYVQVQEGKLFEMCYPKAFSEVLAGNSINSVHGVMYKYLKSLLQRHYGPESIKSIPNYSDFEKSCQSTFQSWSTLPCFNLREALADLLFGVTAKRLISYEPLNSAENLRGCFDTFLENLIAFPINIPGTTYHKCLQGRQKAMMVLKRILRERMSTPNRKCEDFFDIVVAEIKEKESLMTETLALNMIFVLLFTNYETTSLILTVAMKFLSDNPRAVQELAEEHEAILKNRNNPDTGFTWEEYKSMTFTFQVINESLRLANTVPLVVRRSLGDVDIGGYTVPKGWTVMLSLPSVHVNPEIHEDPLVFNPWRWKGKTDITGGSQQFMAFGAGPRLCAGANFSKVIMATFFHNFITKYRWKALRGGNIVRTPVMKFPDGFYVQVFPKEQCA